MVASIQKYSFLLLCPKLGGGGSHVHLVKDNQLQAEPRTSGIEVM